MTGIEVKDCRLLPAGVLVTTRKGTSHLLSYEGLTPGRAGQERLPQYPVYATLAFVFGTAAFLARGWAVGLASWAAGVLLLAAAPKRHYLLLSHGLWRFSYCGTPEEVRRLLEEVEVARRHIKVLS